jgi:hypothetical protein
MKNHFKLLFILANIFFAQFLMAQNAPKDKIGVLQIDSKGLTLDPIQMGNLTRVELEKSGVFEVLDKYDIDYLIQKEGAKTENCFGKTCLVEIGRKLGADKMMTGSVELLNENIVVSLRLIDVGTASVEKTQVMEFLNLKNQVQPMLSVTIKKMFELPIPTDLLSKLTQANDYSSEINTPNVSRLNLSGPRLGTIFFTGDYARTIQLPESQGGIDAVPLMFQFGYQFETSYLNQGGLQALFEFIPMITGLDQGQIIPSCSFLHGLRSNRNGFEFAFGPNIFLTKRASGYFDAAQKWNLERDFDSIDGTKIGFPVVKRFDSRGEFALGTAFVFAAGKSFKSGRLNIPVNAFFIPGKDGMRFGLSVGFNGRG